MISCKFTLLRGQERKFMLAFVRLLVTAKQVRWERNIMEICNSIELCYIGTLSK